MVDVIKVNYIQHLNTFFSHIKKDEEIKPNDISLYLTLFQIWNKHLFRTQFPIIREEVMCHSKIRSRNTYASCLKNLQDKGYITYFPSNRPFVPSQVSIIIFEPHTRTINKPHTRPKIDTPCGSKSEHIYNKQLNKRKQSQTTPKKNSIPTLEETITWFCQHGYATSEARKFFFHNEAVAWILSGQPIADWQAAAAKWSEQIKKTNNDKPGKLHTDANKIYSAPL